MPRPSKHRRLGVWFNGIPVGDWTIDARGEHGFRYVDSWLGHSEARPISLSIPLTETSYVHKGNVVLAYFDNLLPDSSEIRQRIKTRYNAASLSAFDLLAQVGRDCVGAVQLLPEGEQSSEANGIEGRPIDNNEIGNILKGITGLGTGSRLTEEEFRFSLAGAQEKTALLRHDGQWLVPHGSTPTSHIIKLPLGRIGGLGLDMTDSVENEWLCSKLVAALGLHTAKCEIMCFDDVTALVVERFDRKMSESRKRILRIPQEDFCQITGTPPLGKYESDGGPGIETIMALLLGSQEAAVDRTSFFMTQIVFWLLAAPDGHAKNFSVFIERGGRFRLTPLYDIMSAYPVLGHGKGLIPPEKLKLAMAFLGKNRHYEWHKIQLRHLWETARRCGFEGSIERVMEIIINTMPIAVSMVSGQLPTAFPSRIAEPILQGLLDRTKLLEIG